MSGNFCCRIKVSNTVSHLRTEHGTSLETPGISKASRKQSSLSGKESAQACIPKRLLGPKMEKLYTVSKNKTGSRLRECGRRDWRLAGLTSRLERRAESLASPRDEA